MMLSERHRKGGESPLQADGSDTVGRARAQRGRRFFRLIGLAFLAVQP
jgi:hypothetical protein